MKHKDFLFWLGDILLDFKLKIDKPSLELILRLYSRS